MVLFYIKLCYLFLKFKKQAFRDKKLRHYGPCQSKQEKSCNITELPDRKIEIKCFTFTTQSLKQTNKQTLFPLSIFSGLLMYFLFQFLEYIVKELLDMRRDGDTIKYLVHWDGYSHDENSWEPACNISSVLVEQFFSKQFVN